MPIFPRYMITIVPVAVHMAVVGHKEVAAAPVVLHCRIIRRYALRCERDLVHVEVGFRTVVVDPRIEVLLAGRKEVLGEAGVVGGVVGAESEIRSSLGAEHLRMAGNRVLAGRYKVAAEENRMMVDAEHLRMLVVGDFARDCATRMIVDMRTAV